MFIIRLMTISPVIIFLAIMLIIFLASHLQKSDFRKNFSQYIKMANMPSIISLSLTSFVIVILTISHRSPQGPLALIYYGPAALSVGMLIGLIRWGIKK